MERTTTTSSVVAAGCISIERTATAGRVVAGSCVAKERKSTARRVVEAHVAVQRLITVRGIEAADCFVESALESVAVFPSPVLLLKSALSPVRRVVGAGCVAVERTVAIGRVAEAAYVAKERLRTISCVQGSRLCC